MNNFIEKIENLEKKKYVELYLEDDPTSIIGYNFNLTDENECGHSGNFSYPKEYSREQIDSLINRFLELEA
jgi:hypothetical protein